MDELQELHIKGELSEKGYLKETYDENIQDLKHDITEKGRIELKEMFKDVKYRQEFMKLALQEAKLRSPEVARAIIQTALKTIKEYSND